MTATETNLTGRLNRKCMYCGTFLGTKPCEPALDGKTSHGACEPCYAQQMHPELAEKIAKADLTELTLIRLFEVAPIDEVEARLGLSMLMERRRHQLLQRLS